MALPLACGELDLPDGVARHVQVLRLQPGAPLRLFDGRGGEWSAQVLGMGRGQVRVRVEAHHEVDRELSRTVTLAIGMPANERMDALVEKATELGAAAIEPLLCARSVLRPAGERAERRRAHWQAVAMAAAEQCGRVRVPVVAPVDRLDSALAARRDARLLVLSLRAGALPLPRVLEAPGPLRLLSGPEGGLSADEEALALARGGVAVSLGPRVLRADTAPLAALAVIAARDA